MSKITIGKFDLSIMDGINGNKYIYIRINSGESQDEAGIFTIEKLEKVIEQYYNENF
jgi:hypothetical protein